MPTRTAGPSPDRGWRHRAGNDSLAQSRPACRTTLSLLGGDWAHFARPCDGDIRKKWLYGGLRGRFRNRQRQSKDRTLRLILCCREPPAMGLDDRAADCESHADSIGLGRVEGLEQAIEIRRIDSRAGVFHFDEHVVRISLTRDNRELARSVADSVHCLDGIDDYIHDHLLQLAPLRRNKR